MSVTDDYIADVKRRGGVYVPSLPGNTNLGTPVLGMPGARFSDRAFANGLRYELAPYSVAVAANIQNAIMYPFNLSPYAGELTKAATDATKDLGTHLPSVTGAAAKVLGLPQPVLVAALLFAAWMMLRGAGLVPSYRKV